ncbi:hypothetical protein O4O02_29900 [Pseudomonas fortuita]|uniref:hypothetical protein n=1 Tax=Pseudomonas fortuita TaxID=3233375 RepID=UPI003D816805
MPTKAKKTASKTVPSFSSQKTRILLLALVVLLRSPGPLIADQSTHVYQSFYYLQSKHNAENTTMDTIEAETIKKQLEMWEAATEAQRRYVEAQGRTSAARLEELRQVAEFLTAAASSYHLDSMSSTKQPRH